MSFVENLATGVMELIRHTDVDRFDAAVLSRIPKPFTENSFTALPTFLTPDEQLRLMRKMRDDPSWVASLQPSTPRVKKRVRSRRGARAKGPAPKLVAVAAKRNKQTRGGSNEGRRTKKIDEMLELYDEFRARGASIERAKQKTTAELQQRLVEKQSNGKRTTRKRSETQPASKVRNLKHIRRSVDRAVKKYRGE